MCLIKSRIRNFAHTVVCAILLVLILFNALSITQLNTLAEDTNQAPRKCSVFERIQHLFSNDGLVLRLNSESMSPVMKAGEEFGFVKVNFNDLHLGDIIVFHRPAGQDILIVSRVAEIQTDSRGERVITTQGDANPASIPGTDFPIREKNFVGKVDCIYSLF